MFETMMRTKSLLKREIDQINDIGELDDCRLDNLLKAYKTLREISTIEAMDSEYGDDYSTRRTSMRRGRGADGRYMSRSGSYDRGYSGHSVTDRMIASLEREMDMAESDYDRKKIQDEIHRLRESKD